MTLCARSSDVKPMSLRRPPRSRSSQRLAVSRCRRLAASAGRSGNRRAGKRQPWRSRSRRLVGSACRSTPARSGHCSVRCSTPSSLVDGNSTCRPSATTSDSSPVVTCFHANWVTLVSRDSVLGCTAASTWTSSSQSVSSRGSLRSTRKVRAQLPWRRNSCNAGWRASAARCSELLAATMATQRERRQGLERVHFRRHQLDAGERLLALEPVEHDDVAAMQRQRLEPGQQGQVGQVVAVHVVIQLEMLQHGRLQLWCRGTWAGRGTIRGPPVRTTSRRRRPPHGRTANSASSWRARRGLASPRSAQSMRPRCRARAECPLGVRQL